MPFISFLVHFVPLDPHQAWLFCLGGCWTEVLTLDKLKQRGNSCFLCRVEKEIFKHILLHYSLDRVFEVFSQILWGLVECSLSRLERLCSLNIAPLWVRRQKNKKKSCRKVPLCIFLTIWCEQNIQVFDNEALLLNILKSSFPCDLSSNLYIEDSEEVLDNDPAHQPSNRDLAKAQ